MSFLDHQKKRVNDKEISAGTCRAYSKPIKLFCDMNDLTSINWKRILRSLPKARNVAADRAYTVSEIQKLTKYADRRMKVVMFMMCSCGFRSGAWDYLKWGHINPIERHGHIVAAKIRVYADDPEEYYFFITPEAFRVLKDWMDYRVSHGETITKDSWVMRDVWRTSDVKLGAGGRSGLATIPKKIQSGTVQRLLERALEDQGLRTTKAIGPNNRSACGATRYEFKVCHGLRKFCDTRLHEVMDDVRVKNLMGQTTGISDHYNRPDENKLLEEYLKAVPLLTISQNSEIGKMAKKETETQLQDMQKQINLLFETLQSSQAIKQVDEEQKALLITSDRYREVAKEALLEEEQELQEGEEEEILFK